MMWLWISGVLLWCAIVLVDSDIFTKGGCYGPPGTVCTNHFMSCPPNEHILMLNVKLYRRRDSVEEQCRDLVHEQCQFSGCCNDKPIGTSTKIVLPPLVYGQCLGQTSCNVTSPYSDILPSFGFVMYKYYCSLAHEWAFIVENKTGDIQGEKNFVYSGSRNPSHHLNCSCEVGDADGEILQIYLHLGRDACRQVSITVNGTSMFACTDSGVRLYKDYKRVSGKMVIAFTNLTARPNDVVWATYKGRSQFSCTGCSDGTEGITEIITQSTITTADIQSTPNPQLLSRSLQDNDFTKDIIFLTMTLGASLCFIVTCLILIWRVKMKKNES